MTYEKKVKTRTESMVIGLFISIFIGAVVFFLSSFDEWIMDVFTNLKSISLHNL